MYSAYLNIKNIIFKVLNFIVYTTSVIIPVSLFIQVVYRYVFKKPIPGVEELASASFIWLVIFGSVIVFSNQQHIVVDAFVSHRSEKTKKVIRVVDNIIMASIFVILTYSCYIALPNQAVFKTVVLKIPRAAHTIALIISFILMIILSIENIVKELHGGKVSVS